MPVVLGLIIWTFGPMIASLYISFTEYNILKSPEFVGFRNYADMFSRPPLRVLHSLGVTLIYAVFAVPLVIVAALGAALLLNQKLPGMRIFVPRCIFRPSCRSWRRCSCGAGCCIRSLGW